MLNKPISFSVRRARKEKVIPTGMAFFFSLFARSRTRTHSSATPRWTLAETSANTGFYLYFRLRRKCKSSPASATKLSSRNGFSLRLLFALARLGLSHQKRQSPYHRCGKQAAGVGRRLFDFGERDFPRSRGKEHLYRRYGAVWPGRYSGQQRSRRRKWP